LDDCQAYGLTIDDARANINATLEHYDLFFFGERKELIEE
jgi:hypothetical protein